MLSTPKGVARTNVQDTTRTSRSASTKPRSGESTMAAPVLATPLQTIAPAPALATPDPRSPPIRACELLEGMPSPQVIRFQAMAPTRAAKITRGSTTAAR